MTTMELEPSLVLVGRKDGGEWKLAGGDVSLKGRQSLREDMALRMILRHDESLIFGETKAAAAYMEAYDAIDRHDLDRVAANGEEYAITTMTRTVLLPDEEGAR